MNIQPSYSPQMTQQIIKFLQFIYTPKLFSSIMQELNISKKDLLELITVINLFKPSLINTINTAIIDEKTLLSLVKPLNWFDLSKINQLLVKLNQQTYCIKALEVVDSTNTYVLDNLDSLTHKTCVIAEWQINGRGRGANSWVMQPVSDFALSILYHIPSGLQVRLLPLVIAVALSRLLKQFGLSVKIKWPNDIYMTTTLITPKNKICGILIESGFINNKCFVVVGVGVDNVLNVERNLFLCHLINNIDNILNEYLAFGFDLIRQEWLDNCIHYNQTVKIYQQLRLIDSGVHVDLTKDGLLVLQTENSGLRQYDLSKYSLRFYL